jgi:hypothetical protein
MVDQFGQIMFAIYQVTVTIVLVNMLIAMMSHSFEAIQVENGSKRLFLSMSQCNLCRVTMTWSGSLPGRSCG